jgi:hypothetical protein
VLTNKRESLCDRKSVVTSRGKPCRVRQRDVDVGYVAPAPKALKDAMYFVEQLHDGRRSPLDEWMIAVALWGVACLIVIKSRRHWGSRKRFATHGRQVPDGVRHDQSVVRVAVSLDTWPKNSSPIRAESH